MRKYTLGKSHINVWFAAKDLHLLVFYNKPYKCVLCTKSFPTPGDLKLHCVSNMDPGHSDGHGFVKYAQLKSNILTFLFHPQDILSNRACLFKD